MSGNYKSRNNYNSGYARQRSHSEGSGSRQPRRRSNLGGVLVIIALLTVVVVGIFYLFNSNGSAGANAGNTSAPNHGGGKILSGVAVDGIDLGGLTRDEAKQKIEADLQKVAQNTGVTVVDPNGAKTVLKLSDLPAGTYSFDTDATLDQAMGQKEAANLTVKAAVKDPSSFEQKVRGMATPYYKAPVNATYTGYDNTKPAGIERLQFAADQPGSQVDGDALWSAVKSEFTKGTFGTVQMQVVPVPAEVTLAEIQADMQLVGVYETEIKNSAKERRANIELAGNCVSGKFLMPGEQFSLNTATGERTAEKGYQQAPVDNNGVEDVGLGGGVCQVSGTLYNAAINAGPNVIQIDERNHHSLPSAYMGLGKDATVDYPNKDLKFTNISGKPLLIIMYYDYDKSRTKYKYHEHAEIYGAPDPEGATYSLYVVTKQTLPALEGYRVATSNKLQPGEQGTVEAHEGYVVDVYLQKTAKDGTVTKQFKKLYTDTYKPDCTVLLKYKGDPDPTPTPSPTPTPTATPVTEPTPTPTPTPAA